MPRVIGIDPGTVSIDLCGLEDGGVFLDRSIPTSDTLRDPADLVRQLEALLPLDLIAGPSGYGLPLTPVSEVSDDALRLAYLARSGDDGGIGGMRSLARALARSSLPVVLTPGVIHLESVPAHRKVNRVDMGTADKVCAAALAIHEQARRLGCSPTEVSLILLELGGAFTAVLAISHGQIVDGAGGTAGPLGVMAAGALDGEVAFLAGEVTKALLFTGGVTTIRGDSAAPECIGMPRSPRERLAWDAYIEGAVKAVAAMLVSAPAAREIVLSGRMGSVDAVYRALAGRLGSERPLRASIGFAEIAKEAAQGAALIADGLAGGAERVLVETMGIREARGSVLDHLYVISADAARRRLGIAGY